MYANLKNELLKSGITYYDVCKALDISLPELIRKMEYKEFPISEALKIRNEFFPFLPMVYLFKQ